MTPDELLDATLAKARKVPIGGGIDPAEVAREAIARARVEGRVRRAGRGRFVAGAAAAVAALGVCWGAWAATREPATGASIAKTAQEAQAERAAPVEATQNRMVEPRRLRLSTGDVLIGAPSVEFDVLSETRERVVRLSSGEMVFDVAHRPDGRFVVHANDVSVTVLGTVFAVRREQGAVGVRVFEGTVLVRDDQGAELRRLEAGDEWTSGSLNEAAGWRSRSEREWRRIVDDGHRDERRAPARRARSNTRERPHPPAVESSSPRVEDGPAPALARARAMLARGDFEAALLSSQPHEDDGAWLLLRADALRGLGRAGEAARTYERAARFLDRNRRFGAAFAAAQLRARISPEDALRLLEEFGVTSRTSPLEERARALQIQLLYRVGRTDEGDAEALAYEERFGSPR